MKDRMQMFPGPGERLLRFVGDQIRFSLKLAEAGELPAGYKGFLRTNLGRAAVQRREIIESYTGKLPAAGASWRDIPLCPNGNEWTIELPLTEVGYFKAKAYAVDEQGRQIWPDGPDAGITVHPNRYRTANTIYCAFPRMFGESKTAAKTIDEAWEAQLGKLDKLGYTVIPPSGKLRDLIGQLPHIINRLGCRVLHLLPVNPTPTTYARFGRFGSPYAIQDLTAIDPALVEFDRRTTGIDQFRELTYAVHAQGGRVFLDMVINHTGWGSTLQEQHPEWFLKDQKGVFVSPGAWGVTWEDLVELDHRNTDPWNLLAEAFLTWCQRGVDGFRCDAGYKIPMPAWRYITARVHDQYPETIFLLEGLGGSWEATEILLTDGGMQWAYSELFQNYSGRDVAHYLDYSLRQSERVGLYVHYSETHDNDRLARNGRIWSLLRNRLCGLASVSGGYGFTCGVEWLAAEKINVHSSRGMSWGSKDNIADELTALNRLLTEHPCFFDHAKITRLSPQDSPVLALRRESAEGSDRVLVVINLDAGAGHELHLPASYVAEFAKTTVELLGQPLPEIKAAPTGDWTVKLAPGACYCLAATPTPKGLSGDDYRRLRGCSAWGIGVLGEVLSSEEMGSCAWRQIADVVYHDPKAFLAAVPNLGAQLPASRDLETLVNTNLESHYPSVVVWRRSDLSRVVIVPPKHWLLVYDESPFRASLQVNGEPHPRNAESIQVKAGHIVSFHPRTAGAEATLLIERYAKSEAHLQGRIRYLPPEPDLRCLRITGHNQLVSPWEAPIALLTNGRGGMARLCVDLGRVKSKYDCLLGANLHPSVPTDRHIFAKRVRAWVNADRFITPLDNQTLVAFEPGPPASWRFVVNAGDGHTVEIRLLVDMLEGENTTVLRFSRPSHAEGGKPLADSCEVRLTVRVDIEDRNFHMETKRNPGADYHFTAHSRKMTDKPGFIFDPAADRQLRVYATSGLYHHEGEWSEHIWHPVESSRGQTDHGDAYSPGWFDLPMDKGSHTSVVVTAEPGDPTPYAVESFPQAREALLERCWQAANLARHDAFGRQLVTSTHSFVVRRGSGKTVIAGYPWFLDWGRDSLICARGMLAAGMIEETRQLLVTFGRFEENGTLPNSIHGEDASNRDTSDAALWYGVVCEDLHAILGDEFLQTPVDGQGRNIAQVLKNIASGYLRGTPNGIRVDAESGLVWSPSHFTWMDTNYPAGSPRQGYPVEIQVLWIRLLRQLERLRIPHENESWRELANRAEASLFEYFWIEEKGYFADVVLATSGTPAANGKPDDALRSNYLFAVSFGLAVGERARRCVEMALRYLVVPGALRTLAPLPVQVPLAIYGNHGNLLNQPHEPYWPRYEGDEDTRRKPAYHNGTAWTWTFPTFCEALAAAWDFQPIAVAAAKEYLASMDRLLCEGCVGHLPEIVDGDIPHQQRGCDAQAWGATEALRVWKLLHKMEPGR